MPTWPAQAGRAGLQGPFLVSNGLSVSNGARYHSIDNALPKEKRPAATLFARGIQTWSLAFL